MKYNLKIAESVNLGMVFILYSTVVYKGTVWCNAVLRHRNDLLRFRCDIGKVFLPVQVPAPVPVPGNIKQSFPKTHKILPFQYRKQLISQKAGLPFMIWLGSGTGSGSGTVLHSGPGSAKSYGSCNELWSNCRQLSYWSTGKNVPFP